MIEEVAHQLNPQALNEAGIDFARAAELFDRLYAETIDESRAGTNATDVVAALWMLVGAWLFRSGIECAARGAGADETAAALARAVAGLVQFGQDMVSASVKRDGTPDFRLNVMRIHEGNA